VEAGHRAQGTVTFDCALEGGQFVGAFSYENCR
jgi:hypothetical protein